MSELLEPPPRPLVPLAFLALVMVLVTTRLLLWFGRQDYVVTVGATAGAVALAGIILAGVLRGRGGALPTLAALAASCALAALVTGGELARQRILAEALRHTPVSSCLLRVESDMSEGTSGWRGRARVDAGSVAGEVWLLADEPLDLGDSLACVGRFSPNQGDEWGALSRSQGLAGTVRVVRVLDRRPGSGMGGLVLGARKEVLSSLDASFSDARALVAGAVCGSTRAMSERGLDDLFATCGVSHLVAVSGGHLVLIASVLTRALERTGIGVRARLVTLLVLTGAFVAFCGAPDSAVRSWAMSLASSASVLAGRRTHPLSSASVVALLMALWEPGVTGRLGYLLSVASVCGICLLGPYVRYLLRVLFSAPRLRSPRVGGSRVLRSMGSSALDALSMTLVAQLVTAPLTCPAFGTLSLVAPLANVVLSPLFSALLVLGMAASLAAFAPPLQAALLFCCEVVGMPLVSGARALAALPGACVAVSVSEGPALLALLAVVCGLLALWPRVSRRALLLGGAAVAALALAWHVRWRYLAPARVCVLDVGQADAVLVSDGSAAVLVDTGLGEEVLPALARNNVRHLDAVVLTHLHDDHVGGLEAVLGAYGVRRVVVAEGVDVGDCGVPVTEVSSGDSLFVGGFRLDVLWPVDPVDGLENEDSLVIAVSYDEGDESLTALLTGDAEAPVLEALRADGRLDRVDLLKVGHHGSEASVTAEVAELLEPGVSVASAGEGNRYGHPDPVCIGTLEGAGSVFLCTIEAGDVCVEPGREGPLVRCGE